MHRGRATVVDAPGEDVGGAPRLGFGILDRRRTVFFADTGAVKRLLDPARAIAPLRQRPRAAFGKSGIVDIAEFDKPLGQGVDRRFALPFPAAFVDFASQITRQLGARRSAKTSRQKRFVCV